MRSGTREEPYEEVAKWNGDGRGGNGGGEERKAKEGDIEAEEALDDSSGMGGCTAPESRAGSWTGEDLAEAAKSG